MLSNLLIIKLIVEYYDLKFLCFFFLQTPVWFTYGCCASAAQNFKLAAKAFKNCVLIDTDVSLCLSSNKNLVFKYKILFYTQIVFSA